MNNAESSFTNGNNNNVSKQSTSSKHIININNLKTQRMESIINNE